MESDAGGDRQRCSGGQDGDALIVFEIEQMRIPETIRSACAASAQART